MAPSPESSKHSSTVLDAMAWFSNVATSVCLVFIVKSVFLYANGFVFSVILCGLHFAFCAIFLRIAVAVSKASIALISGWRLPEVHASCIP